MTPDTALRYHLILLIAEHGRQRVLNTLSDVLRLSAQELDTQLLPLLQSVKAKLDKPEPSTSAALSKVVEELTARHPDKAAALRMLAVRLINRTFLTELKDIRQFIERKSDKSGNIKSRQTALPLVMKILSTLPHQELDALCQEPETSPSAFSVLSDHILGKDRK